jgi:hypothetical protein
MIGNGLTQYLKDTRPNGHLHNEVHNVLPKEYETLDTFQNSNSNQVETNRKELMNLCGKGCGKPRHGGFGPRPNPDWGIPKPGGWGIPKPGGWGIPKPGEWGIPKPGGLGPNPEIRVVPRPGEIGPKPGVTITPDPNWEPPKGGFGPVTPQLPDVEIYPGVKVPGARRPKGLPPAMWPIDGRGGPSEWAKEWRRENQLRLDQA